MKDISDKIAVIKISSSTPFVRPYVFIDCGGTSNNRTVSVRWLEYCEVDEPSEGQLLSSISAKKSASQSVEYYNELPTFTVKFLNSPQAFIAYRCVCDRAVGGEVGIVRLKRGCLWTIL